MKKLKLRKVDLFTQPFPPPNLSSLLNAGGSSPVSYMQDLLNKPQGLRRQRYQSGGRRGCREAQEGKGIWKIPGVTPCQWVVWPGSWHEILFLTTHTAFTLTLIILVFRIQEALILPKSTKRLPQGAQAGFVLHSGNLSHAQSGGRGAGPKGVILLPGTAVRLLRRHNVASHCSHSSSGEFTNRMSCRRQAQGLFIAL